MRDTTQLCGSLLAVAALIGLHAPAVTAQPRENQPVELPAGPAKPGFDIERFSNAGNGWFKTFYVGETRPLSQAEADGAVAADTRVLVLQTRAGRLALLTDQMAYHHLAQGSADGDAWLATF